MWYDAPFNIELIKLIQTISSPFFDKLFILATMMGEEYFFMAVVVIIYWCIDKNFGYRMGFAYLSNGVINSGIKEVFKVPRPFNEGGIRSLRIETATGYSFPSGHTQCSASIWMSVMLKIKKVWMYITGSVLMLLVGISRLYLGVHRPIDVIAGLVIGILWVFVSNSMFDYAEKTGKNSIFLLFIVPMIVLMAVFQNAEYFKISGTAAAFFIGYILEPRFIRFKTDGRITIQIIKIVVGFGVLLGIKSVFKGILPVSILSDFIRYMLMGLWVTLGAPFIFKAMF